MKTVSFALAPATIRGALIFAGKADIRATLNGLAVHPQAKGAAVVGTDGHRLTVIYEETAFSAVGVTPPEDFRVILPRDALENALKVCDKRTPAILFHVDVTAPGKADDLGRLDARSYAVRIVASGTTLECASIAGRWVEWQRVVPARGTERDALAVTGYDAAYLADYVKLLKALRPSANAYPGITILQNGNSAARVCIGDDRALCILMPMRTGDVCACDWFYSPEPASKDKVAA